MTVAAGGGNGAVADTTAPVLRLRAAKRLRLAGALKVTAQCDEVVRR